MKKGRILIGLGVYFIAIVTLFIVINVKNNKQEVFSVDLSNLTYEKNNNQAEIKKYTKDDFDEFKTDYENNDLNEVYVTEFLFDGVSMYKPYDLDDFLLSGNDLEVDALDITVVNVNKTGDTLFTGEITGGMIAVNTNDIEDDINLILNGVKIDTDSKKVPAIYVYNKDINYTDNTVTIELATNSKNYIDGGKLKKVSLVANEDLTNYTSKYSGDNKSNYETYTNYYGVYTTSEIDDILFAKIAADEEDLRDGDPYYFYKASGAISSDIDLYFKGDGYLEVTSKKKEGIETKGNLTLGDGKGDYVVYALDDCLNTTTDSVSNKDVRNTLTIDVNSLTAIVLEDADEGDAIDSNGDLIIDGGEIIALSHPGQDSGLDASNGTTINGGTIIATGDMYDEISSDSKQNFILLSFNEKNEVDDLITLLDENDNVIFAYKTDRIYTNLVYSSEKLNDGTYYLYKNGEIDGTQDIGFYTKINDYTKGTMLAYESKGNMGMQGGMRPNENEMNDNNMTPPTQNNRDDSRMPEPPSNFDNNNNNNNPEKPDDDMIPQENDSKMNPFNNTNINETATNKEFVIDGISNLYSGIATYTSNN